MAPRRIVLAEYFCSDEGILLFGVDKDWDTPKVIDIPIRPDVIRRYAQENFGFESGAAGQDPVEKLRHLDLDEFQSLFGPLIEPVKAWTDPGDYVYLVPHDALHYLPLHALKLDDLHLIERNPIIYTPSASILKYCQARPNRRRKQALVFGYSDATRPLPHAYAQAMQVANLFGVKPYLGADARKSVLLAHLQNEEERQTIDVLHFACHGQFDPIQPLQSSILMAPEPKSATDAQSELPTDGLDQHLTAEAWFSLHTNANLITLSACQSGVSRLRPGDELFGLTRALLYAGTPSVVMSLWSVDDVSTGMLMQAFYTAFQLGETKAEALQHAQLRVKNASIAEAVTYCEKVASELQIAGLFAQTRLVLRDIADLRARAHDVHPARAAYEDLLKEATGAERVALEHRLSFYAVPRASQVIDYTIKPYDHPVWWAPFILVGDWK